MDDLQGTVSATSVPEHLAELPDLDPQQPADIEELKTEDKQYEPIPAGSRPQVSPLIIPKSPPPPVTPDAQAPLPYDPPKTYKPVPDDLAESPRLSWFAASTAFKELSTLVDDIDASADEAIRHLAEACRARDAVKEVTAMNASFHARLEAHDRLADNINRLAEGGFQELMEEAGAGRQASIADSANVQDLTAKLCSLVQQVERGHQPMDDIEAEEEQMDVEVARLEAELAEAQCRQVEADEAEVASLSRADQLRACAMRFSKEAEQQDRITRQAARQADALRESVAKEAERLKAEAESKAIVPAQQAPPKPLEQGLPSIPLGHEDAKETQGLDKGIHELSLAIGVAASKLGMRQLPGGMQLERLQEQLEREVETARQQVEALAGKDREESMPITPAGQGIPPASFKPSPEYQSKQAEWQEPSGAAGQPSG